MKKLLLTTVAAFGLFGSVANAINCQFDCTRLNCKSPDKFVNCFRQCYHGQSSNYIGNCIKSAKENGVANNGKLALIMDFFENKDKPNLRDYEN